MEESKSVPGARKVRKPSSGNRSGRSSRKSSHSSLASLTDSEIPDTPEPAVSDDVACTKKNLPNGTHSDEDKNSEQNRHKEKDVRVPEGSKNKDDDTVKQGTSNKQDDEKTFENVNTKPDKIDCVNVNTHSDNKVIQTENAKDINSSISENEQLAIEENKNLDIVESIIENKKEVHSEVIDKDTKKVIQKIKDGKVEKNKDSKVKKNKEKLLNIEKNEEKEDEKSIVEDKKTDSENTGDKDSNENLSEVSIFEKHDDLKERESDESSGTILLESRDKESSPPKYLSSESKEKYPNKKSKRKESQKAVQLEKLSEAGSSESLNKIKSDDETSEDDSCRKLDFAGFETPSNEKSTMFFRILDDIRLDDSVMEEMAEGEGDSESEKREEVNKDDMMSTTSSTPSLSSIKSSGSVPRKRQRDRSGVKKPPLDLSHPQYLKPFEYGWKRELVYRSVSDTGSSKRNADIYYYTPKGKKVRSTREVIENLTDPELTIDNFTFFKEPIGIKDPEKEIIREAKIRGDRDISATPPPAKKIALPKTPKVGDGQSPLASSLVTDSPLPERSQIEGNKNEELSPSKASGSNFSATPKIVLKSVKNSSKNKTTPKPLFTTPSKSSGSSKDKVVSSVRALRSKVNHPFIQNGFMDDVELSHQQESGRNIDSLMLIQKKDVSVQAGSNDSAIDRLKMEVSYLNDKLVNVQNLKEKLVEESDKKCSTLSADLVSCKKEILLLRKELEQSEATRKKLKIDNETLSNRCNELLLSRSSVTNIDLPNSNKLINSTQSLSSSDSPKLNNVTHSLPNSNSYSSYTHTVNSSVIGRPSSRITLALDSVPPPPEIAQTASSAHLSSERVLLKHSGQSEPGQNISPLRSVRKFSVQPISYNKSSITDLISVNVPPIIVPDLNVPPIIDPDVCFVSSPSSSSSDCVEIVDIISM